MAVRDIKAPLAHEESRNIAGGGPGVMPVYALLLCAVVLIALCVGLALALTGGFR